MTQELGHFHTPDPRQHQDADAPVCPKCRYVLLGLENRGGGRCPECGTELVEDLTQYRPSRRRTPWSGSRQPWQVIRGAWFALRHPLAAQALCQEPHRVVPADACLFAIILTALVVLIWPWIRRASPEGLMVLFITWNMESWIPRGDWVPVWMWEGWSILRWWALLGLTAAWPWGSRKRPSGERIGVDRLKRLALFAPWIFVLEVEMLVSAWIVDPGTVPEPSSFWGGMQTLWQVRSAVTLPVFGLYAAAVMGIRSPRRVAAMAAALALAGGLLSLLWMRVYLTVFL